MKKICLLISALTLFLSAMIFTGCDGENEFVAPKDTWVYKASNTNDNSFTYTWTSSDNQQKSVAFDIYVNYATKEDTLSFKSSGTANVKPGINILLVPADNSDESSLKELLKDATDVANICIFKSFGTSATASSSSTASDETTDDTNEKSINLSIPGLWTLIYNFNRFDKYTDKQFDQFTSGLTLVDTSTTLSWKRILYNMLGASLFNEQ